MIEAKCPSNARRFKGVLVEYALEWHIRVLRPYQVRVRVYRAHERL